MPKAAVDDIEKAKKAIQILADVTEPANISRITRAGYVAVEESLQFLKSFVDKLDESPNPETDHG